MKSDLVCARYICPEKKDSYCVALCSAKRLGLGPRSLVLHGEFASSDRLRFVWGVGMGYLHEGMYVNTFNIYIYICIYIYTCIYTHMYLRRQTSAPALYMQLPLWVPWAWTTLQAFFQRPSQGSWCPSHKSPTIKGLNEPLILETPTSPSVTQKARRTLEFAGASTSNHDLWNIPT